MIDLHTHTIFSDGELIPAELIQRADAMGHRGIALTDHADMSNLEFVLENVQRAVRELNPCHRVKALAGVELTHVPPELIAPMTQRARELGAQIVVVHGETIVEPVAPGTNLAALEAGVDLLAHPGLLTPQEAALAAGRGVLLELSARKGHALGNGLVARLALEAGASLVVDTDSHAPGDLINRDQAIKVALGAGLSMDQAQGCLANSADFLTRALSLQV